MKSSDCQSEISHISVSTKCYMCHIKHFVIWVTSDVHVSGAYDTVSNCPGLEGFRTFANALPYLPVLRSLHVRPANLAGLDESRVLALARLLKLARQGAADGGAGWLSR